VGISRDDLPDDILPEGFPDEMLEGVSMAAEFRVVTLLKEDGPAIVLIKAGNNDGCEEPPFAAWMTAAEYFTAITATKSNAGFEKACELISEGAMTYKHLAKPE
jgi:hypothetical protein